jgi:5'-nucleotidase
MEVFYLLFPFKKKLSIFLVLTMFFTVFNILVLDVRVYAEEESTVTTITILHTNDIHGRVHEGPGFGFAKISTLVKQFRAENPNTLLLDAGDTFHGLPIATVVQGESIVRIMNAIGYDVMVAGNHDFNYGQDRLLELVEMADFPILGGNVLKGEEKFLQDYIIKEVDGIKIGIFGLATPETLYKSHPRGVEGLTFLDPVETAKEMVEYLKDKVDIIIALGHLGIDEESEHTSEKVINEVPGIHLFVDGHSHSVLPNGKKIGDTLLVSAGEYGKFLGVVELKIKDGELLDVEAKLISREDVADLEPDQEIIDLIKDIEKDIDEALSEVVGETKVKLEGARDFVRTRETNLGNLIADAMLSVSGADVALTNGGGIRASIEVGEITRKDIVTVLPFGNSVEVIKVTGKTIKEALEHGTDAYPGSKGAFPHVAGMTYKIDLNRDIGDRIVDIYINGEPLDLEKEYTLATNDFLAAGGDGYTMFVGAPVVSSLLALDEALALYIKELGLIEYQVEGRITVIEVTEQPIEPEEPGDEEPTEPEQPEVEEPGDEEPTEPEQPEVEEPGDEEPTEPEQPEVEEPEDEENPKTGDKGVAVYGLIALLSGGYLLLNKKKYKDVA